jgi:hypothetical protein
MEGWGEEVVRLNYETAGANRTGDLKVDVLMQNPVDKELRRPTTTRFLRHHCNLQWLCKNLRV